MYKVDLNMKGVKPKDLYDEDIAYFYGLLFYDDKNMADAINYFYSMIKQDKTNATMGTVFKYSNENLRELFAKIDVKSKRVLTVGSSGDQLINAIFYGAKQVDLIDANIFSKPFIELKIAAIKGLELDEFLDCFKYINISESRFLESYQKFSHLLSKDMQYFWDNVFIDGMADKLSEIIGTFNGGISKRGSVFYNDEQLFELLKTKLNAGDYQISYVNAELGDFSKKASGEYDVILLSNIIDYFSSKKEEKYFKKAIKNLYENNLKPDGLLQITSSLTSRNEAYRIMHDLGLGYFRVENGGFDYHDAVMIKKPDPKEMEKIS